MKALMKLKPEVGFWMQDVEIPTIGHNEVLIKIKMTAICGTDLHLYQWDDWAQQRSHIPLIMGHEFMGEIVEVGQDVQHLKPGMRVSGEGHISCGICHHCRTGLKHVCPNTKGIGIQRDGAFAEYLSLPAENVIPIPDSISDEVAAILDPLGNAVHTTLSFDMVGENVIITGAGPIGLMATAIAKHIGAHHIVVTDVNEVRLELAKKMGATHIVNVKEQEVSTFLKEHHLEDFGVGLELSGNPEALKTLLSTIQNAGHIALLGIPTREFAIDWNQVIFKGLTIKGIYGRKMYETWYKMLNLIEEGLDITPIITHRFQVDDFARTFQVIKDGKSGKMLLHWGKS